MNKKIFLDKNENPYKPSKNIIKELEKFDIESLRFFPEYSPQKLDEQIAKYLNIENDNIISVNGMYEAFACIINSYDKYKIFLQEPYRDLYIMIFSYYKMHYDVIKAREDYNISLKNNIKNKNSIIIASNPNAETGMFINIKEIEEFLKEYEGIYVIDESYINFAGESAVKLINEYKNLIIIRSIAHSHSISGLNINFIVSSSENIENMSKLRQKYSVNKISETIMTAALQDEKTSYNNIFDIVLERERLDTILSKEGFIVIPSKANFLLIKHVNKESDYIYEELIKRNIFVKKYDKENILSDFLRVTISAHKINNILINTLKDILYNN
ncbi:aminotransferase class I/II-fold pyridoxal phosphate-dependent enzyme [Brachyspira hampsonii]|uniref:Histidinol phosphate aminotransferase n=2 Tax=Brachyspira hampsonii TaxID=1287055 RepID=A0AAC9TTX3_9SPIR|nr:histidinol-phosphate transaminase [Brachyspira hampsonii]ASJ21766.1 histidinol phosphate aminotransferase [Brachyspira hampsonii]ELV05102.1 histidinol-phosphate aminotransferase [Brachyspira hampsonii 30599]OEJ18779.1 histidinol phosphate aminotransferase [Brachyspira hampsonii]